MDRISFPCPGCGVTLAVASAHRGKTAACPKCQHRSQVPEFEVAEAPAPSPPPPPAPPPSPPPAPEELVRFPCLHCRVKVKVSAAFAGRTVDCPECGKRTLVPELDEVGTFGLAGAARPAADDEEPADERPLAEWWPDGTRLNLPVSWRAPLATAREHAESERWTKAVGLLNGVYQKSLDTTDGGSPVVRKSLAFCLGRWAARGLDRLEEDGEKPSKPVRRVLKLASEKLRFGGSFSTTACPLCDRRLDHLVGTTQIRTKAGSAYVCCAAPTRSDLGLVAEVANINRKLLVGMSLDSENAQIPAALARLPEWFRVVDMGPAGWTKRIVDTSGGIGGDVGGGEVAGEIAGHLAVRMIAGMLSA